VKTIETDPKAIAASLSSLHATAMQTILPKVGASNDLLKAEGIAHADLMEVERRSLITVDGIEARLTRLGTRVHKALVSSAPLP
jgi:hypothetical protein